MIKPGSQTPLMLNLLKSMTEFKPIPSCPGYQASACGQIKGPRKLLKLYLGTRGYLTFRVPTGGACKSKNFYVHRAVAEAWGLDIKDKVINHIDHDKLNNNINNLEACSQVDNLKACISFYGKQLNQRYTNEHKERMKQLKEIGLSYRSIAKQIGCDKNTVIKLLGIRKE